MITFRKAAEEDLELIRDIAYQTWPSTYDSLVGKAQVEYMLGIMYNTGVLLEQLKSGHNFILAEDNQKVMGFAGFSNVDPDKAVYKLHKLYVLPEMHGRGAGKILITEVIDQVRRMGADALQLNVNRKNKALHFYEKCGFKIKETVNIDIGNGFFMNDYVMELTITG